jgi:hypothetical protein
MRRILRKVNFVMIAILMFSVGFWADSYLRARNTEHISLVCTTFKCNFIFLADNPSIALKHPIETFKALIYSN